MGTHDAAGDPRNDKVLAWVNGEFVPAATASVSIYDSGFMLGDGVWEGLRLHHGRWAFAADHLDRLYEAARAIDLDIGRPRADLLKALEDTARANGMTDDVHARLMVTRGRKTRPFQHPKFSRSGPTIVIIMEHSVAVAGREAGVRLATVPQVRGLPMAQDPKLNSHSKLNCILACIQAEKAGADEALMLDPLGFVNTTNACNVFFVRRGVVLTSTGDYCMNGITRGKVIMLARENGIPCETRNFSLTEAYGSEEAFLTGTFGGLTAVAALDGRQYGNGGPGPLTRHLRTLYAGLIARETA
jgi:branched-chain amino acid aminotransferase